MATMTKSEALESSIRNLLRQGADPRQYRSGMARSLSAAGYAVTVEDVDAAIAAIGGAPREVHPEVLAQELIAEERRLARERPAEYRAAQHEED